MGLKEGEWEGLHVGKWVGKNEGGHVGANVGFCEGIQVGLQDGEKEGLTVGWKVGEKVGEAWLGALHPAEGVAPVWCGTGSVLGGCGEDRALIEQLLTRPSITMSVVEGAGHSPHRDAPEETMRQLWEALA